MVLDPAQETMEMLVRLAHDAKHDDSDRGEYMQYREMALAKRMRPGEGMTDL